MSKTKRNARLNEKGQEVLDPNPVAVPVGFRKPPSLHEMIAKYVRAASEDAKNRDMDTFEEADDFEVGDDYDPQSPWEMEFDPLLGKEVTRAEKAYLDQQRSLFDAQLSEKITTQRKSKNSRKENEEESLHEEVPRSRNKNSSKRVSKKVITHDDEEESGQDE